MFPRDSYDLTGEFGRSSFDIRHRFTVFGTINLPWWKVVVNPFVIANSGPGFNITTGQDRNLDRQLTERPSFAARQTLLARSTIKCTRFGKFNLEPLPGETIIPRNFGQAPGFWVVNLRVSRAFAFGTINRGNAAAQGRRGQTAAAAGSAGRETAYGWTNWREWSRWPNGGGRGGPRAVAGGPGSTGGGGAAAASEKRFISTSRLTSKAFSIT